MPDWRRVIRERLEPARLPPAQEAEIVDEIAQHVEDRHRDAIARGLSEADAERESLAEIDARERMVKDLARLPKPPAAPPVGNPAPGRLFAGFRQDLRYTLRLLRRSPAFSIAAILTIALSTAPTITALGVTNWLFLRPIPGVEQSGRLVSIFVGQWSPDGNGVSPSWVSYDDLGRLNSGLRSLQGLAGHSDDDVAVSVDDSEPRLESVAFVTANYFDVLGVRVSHGRALQPDDDRNPGGSPVAVIEPGFASRHFGSAAAALGRQLRLNGEPVQVIGVVAGGFHGPGLTDRIVIWVPGQMTRRLSHVPAADWPYQPGEGPFYQLLGRLAPKASVSQADAELRVLMRALADAGGAAEKYRTVHPTTWAGVGIGLFERAPMWDLVRLILWVGVALVLLGVANLANLFLWRQTRRTPDAAVRRALGASGARLARLPVLEAIVLAVAGGTLGLVLALAARAALRGVNIPFFGEMDLPMDWRLLAMALGLSAGVGIVLSLLPARLAARADLGRALGRSSRGATPLVGRVRTGLAVVQVAMSLALLVGALLFARTLQNLGAVDLGFDARGVTNIRLSLRQQGYVGPRNARFHRDLLAHVQADRSIEAASLALAWPFSGFSRRAAIHRPGDDPKSPVRLLMNEVTPGYFQTLGLPLVAGRAFTEAETFQRGPEPGLIIGEAVARKFFGETPAVGQTLVFAGGGLSRGQEIPIVGVVRDTHWNSFDGPELMIYRPVWADGMTSSILVRSARPPDEVLRIVREAIRQIDPSVPAQLGTLQAVVAERMTAQRIRAWAVGVLALIGFVLAAVGIQGLISQAVVDRTREFGIRRAVGAGSREVAALVLRQGLMILAIGVPLGLVASAVASRLIRGQLFGITPLEPWVYVAAALALAAVALGACLIPARRAMNVDPVEVLRSE